MGEDEESTMVLLRERSSGNLYPVPVGAFEASAIIIEMEGIVPPRPLTHDVLSAFFRRHRFVFERFELYGADSEGFLGRIHYRRGFRKYSMEVRPSDGIALAIRLGAPIVASREALDAKPPANVPAIPFPARAEDVLFLGDRSAEAGL